MRFDRNSFAGTPPDAPWAAYLIAMGFESGVIDIHADRTLPEVLWPLRAITASYAPFKIVDDSMSPQSWEFGVGPCAQSLPPSYRAERTWTIAGDSGHSWVLAACWDADLKAVDLRQLSTIDEPDEFRIGSLHDQLRRWVHAALAPSGDELSVDFGAEVQAVMFEILRGASTLRSHNRVRANEMLHSLEAAIDGGADDEETVARWEQAQQTVDLLGPAAWEVLLADRDED